MASVTVNENSSKGNYSGSGGSSSHAPVNVTFGKTSFTPTVTHSKFGSHHTFGAGLNVERQVTPSTSFNAHAHHHGGSNTFGVGFRFNF